MAGELDTPPERSLTVPEAHFKHPEILELQLKCFDVDVRLSETTQKIHWLKDRLKTCVGRFVDTFKIDLLVVENVLAIPLNIPLAIALVEFIAETSMPTIAHHHDFFWERKRFLTNAVWDYINMAFPPHLPSIHHVVINSSADNQISLRTGISATMIPNVMDFENPPPPLDKYSSDAREAFGIAPGELFFLQPTRIVKRKGIEHAIELVRRLGRKAKLVISHASGDEGDAYEQRVRDYSKLMEVDTLFICKMIQEQRGTTDDGKKIYTLYDVYPHADIVTYPSDFEGFGNAFLETMYFRKPIVVNSYSIYAIDIRPKGFNVIEFDGYITDVAIERTREVLDDPRLREEMVEHNYELARKYYSFAVLRQKLRTLITDCFGA
jgi:glycosyltransferase involved in cell wall biosynthesis